MTRPEGLHPSTLAVTLGRPAHAPGAAVGGPVSFTSTYRAHGERVYGRDHNETWEALEEAVGALEGGEALAFASGLAAISAVIETLPAGAVVVAPAGAYNGTRRLLADLASRGRLTPRLVDITDTAATVAACEGAALLWVESPTNPMLDVADIAALAAGAHERGVPVAADNTFATPLLQRPLDLGADVVVHSLTKMAAGHSDVVLGAVVTRDPAWLERLRNRRSLHGAIPGPMEAFLALRGLRTLPVRLDRAQATAKDLVARLGAHPGVECVRYPGFGTVLAFEPVGGAEAADRVCAAVCLLVPATSLGGVETLIERRGRYRGEEGIPPALLRVSVGLEHPDDLWVDLAQALAAATTASAG